jgi:DNA polymerase III alpha subunit (gram-positive type)
MSLVFLDTETTGLDPALHEVWEIAWAIDDGPIESRILTHSIKTADPEALELNGYWDRGEGYYADPRHDHTLRAILTGATVVGSNPAFDTAFLRARWGVAPWHHRLLAVESMAYALFRYDKAKGLAGVADDVRAGGYEVPAPDHTAAGDVATLRAVFNALREWSA